MMQYRMVYLSVCLKSQDLGNVSEKTDQEARLLRNPRKE